MEKLNTKIGPTSCPSCGEADALVTGYDPKQATCRFCGFHTGSLLESLKHDLL